MDVPLLTTKRFWEQRKCEGWCHRVALCEPTDEPDDPINDDDWLALSQLESLTYDRMERLYPGIMPYDDMWLCDHHGVLFYPRWALEWSWARLVGRQQVVRSPT